MKQTQLFIPLAFILFFTINEKCRCQQHEFIAFSNDTIVINFKNYYKDKYKLRVKIDNQSHVSNILQMQLLKEKIKDFIVKNGIEIEDFDRWEKNILILNLDIKLWNEVGDRRNSLRCEYILQSFTPLSDDELKFNVFRFGKKNISERILIDSLSEKHIIEKLSRALNQFVNLHFKLLNR